ncbi:MAG: S1C family serine protease [Fidelibacterota bacterium]
MFQFKYYPFWAVLVLQVVSGQYNLDQDRHTAVTRAINTVSPAVASINVTQVREYATSPFFQDPWFQFFLPPQIYKEKVKGSGSGVVISPDGYVLTNYHVVEQATEVVITLPGGKEYEAEMVGTDQVTDLALLKLEGKDFPYAVMGNSDNLIIGEWVVALGNPFGLFDVSNQPTATAGIISATKMDFGQQSSGRIYQEMIQTDAAINPGNSGGPLVNSNGEVIGINTFIFTGSRAGQGSIGIGFAIPINRARKIAEELKRTGHIEREFSTGLSVQPLTQKIARYLSIPITEGVIIVEIQKGSTAEKARLEVGDVIVAVEGESVHNSQGILRIIEENDFRPGDKIRLRVWRNGNYFNKIMKLGKL